MTLVTVFVKVGNEECVLNRLPSPEENVCEFVCVPRYQRTYVLFYDEYVNLAKSGKSFPIVDVVCFPFSLSELQIIKMFGLSIIIPNEKNAIEVTVKNTNTPALEILKKLNFKKIDKFAGYLAFYWYAETHSELISMAHKFHQVVSETVKEWRRSVFDLSTMKIYIDTRDSAKRLKKSR